MVAQQGQPALKSGVFGHLICSLLISLQFMQYQAKNK